jgi:hypothetical protein
MASHCCFDRTAVYEPVRTVVGQGKRVIAYLCQFHGRSLWLPTDVS